MPALSPARRQILGRALWGLAGVSLAAVTGVLLSDDFRAFVGDELAVTLIVTAVVPALRVLELKVAQRRAAKREP